MGQLPAGDHSGPHLRADAAAHRTYFGAKFGQNPGIWLMDPMGKDLDRLPVSSAMRQNLQRGASASLSQTI